MPSKIVRWTVVVMKFQHRQPIGWRRLELPVDVHASPAWQRATMLRNTQGMQRSSETTWPKHTPTRGVQ